jgi:hypothetical protein
MITAREMLLTGDIEPVDYKALRMDHEEKVYTINLKISELKGLLDEKMDIETAADNAVNVLSELPRLYQKVNISAKRYLVGIIFNGLLVYDKDGYRTTEVDSIATVTYLKNKELQGNKKGEKYLKKTLFPNDGWMMGLEPTTPGTTNQCSNQLSYNHRVF